MALTFHKLHQHFVGEASPVELRTVHDEETLARIRAGMDQYAVLVFHDQAFSDAEQIAFGERLDGRLHQGTGSRAFTKSRLDNEALSDISNLAANGEIMKADDRRRHYTLGNRLWHTDASFVDPPGRYSMLHARVVPPVPADTEFADMRTAYDALMLQLHDRMKQDAAYQKDTPQTGVDFPAGSTWVTFTDQVSHAALSGQYQLEQTFLLPVHAMLNENRSPLRILERRLGRRLT